MTKPQEYMLWFVFCFVVVQTIFALCGLLVAPTDPRLVEMLDLYCGPREHFDGYCIHPGESCCLDGPDLHP